MLHLKLSKKLPYLLFFLCSVMASSEQAHHKAHEHGHAKLEVMFDGKTLKTNFEIPASNVVGFEHRAKNPTEKKTLQDAIALLEKAAAVVSSPECQQQSQSVKLLQEGASHAEFEIQIELSCPKIPKNIEVTLFQTLDRKSVV